MKIKTTFDMDRALFFLTEFINFVAPRKVPESASKPRPHYPGNFSCYLISIVCGAASAAWMALRGYFVAFSKLMIIAGPTWIILFR